MADKQEKAKHVLIYDEDSDDFTVTDQITEGNTHLIIDENSQTTTLSFAAGAGLVKKRTIERRVASYVKTGFPHPDGFRVGAHFTFEKITSDEPIPDTLLTHGHTFGKAKLIHDEVPDYVEKEDNYEVVVGSAARIKMTASQPVHVSQSDTTVTLTPTPDVQSTPEPSPSPVVEVKPVTPEPVSEPSSSTSTTPVSTDGTTIESKTSDEIPSDDSLFALGQFVDQFTREGKVVIVYYRGGNKYELIKLKNLQVSSEVEAKYELDGLDLYQI